MADMLSLERRRRERSASCRRAPRRVNEIVLGQRAVTADTDLRLARFFGVSEGFFLGLQMVHDLRARKREIAKDLLGIVQHAAG